MQNVGPIVLADLVEKGNAAIAWHQSAEAKSLRRLPQRQWAHQVWRRDPRFADLLPKTDQTVAQIAPEGHQDHQRILLANLEAIQRRVDEIARQSPDERLREWAPQTV